MAHDIIISTDILLQSLYYILIFIIISEFKRAKLTGLIILAVYQLSSTIADWLTVNYAPGTGFINDYTVLILPPVDIIFTLGFLAVFLKGNPFSNYVIFIVTDIINQLMLSVFSGIRETLFPDTRALGLVQSWNDWPALASDFLAFALTLVILKVTVSRLHRLLSITPNKVIYTIILIDLAFNAVTVLLMFLENYDSGYKIILASLVVLTFILMLLALALIWGRYNHERTNRKLITLEMEMQYEYYSLMCEITRQLRDLKHDMSNHLAVIDTVGEIDNAAQKKYTDQLLSYCDTINSTLSSFSPPENVILRKLTSKENIELNHYIRELSKYAGIPDEELITEHSFTREGVEKLLISYPAAVRKIKSKNSRESVHYNLIKEIVLKHDGNIDWVKGNGKWILVICI